MDQYPPLSQLGGAPQTFGTGRFGNLLANLGRSAAGILLAPGQIYQSQTPVTTGQMIKPAADIAMMTTLGAGAVPAEADALRMGMGQIGNRRPKGTTTRTPVIEAHPAEQLRMSEQPGGVKLWETPTQQLVQTGFGDYRLMNRSEDWGKYGISQPITNEEGKGLAELWEGIKADAVRKQSK
jgi:hypothetical protein